MSIPRPKLLTVVTVPTGGWAFDIDASVAAQYDTSLTGTVPAGDYFISGDNQSDDLLFALQTAIQTAIAGAGLTGAVYIGLSIITHRVVIQFVGASFVDATGDNDVRLNWATWDEDCAAALGFDVSAPDTSTGDDNPAFFANWQHGYGWYADEDGQLASMLAEDVNEVNALRSRAIDGGVIVQYVGDAYDNALQLQFLSRALTFSNGVRYGAANVHPYERNQGLECWWMEAREGKRFRVYEDGRVAAAVAGDGGTSSASNTTTLTDAAKSWDTDPQRWKGRLVFILQYAEYVPQLFYIASHTATVITVPNAHPSGDDVDGGSGGAAGQAYYVLDHPYRTYVLGEMQRFEPRELPVIDRYNITIPLFRYVA